MTFIDEKIRVLIEQLMARMTVCRDRVDSIRYTKCGYKTSNRPPEDAEWQEFCGELISTPDSHYWFMFSLEIPEEKSGFEYRLSAKTGREGQWDATNPQCTLFIDGESAYQALDTHHTWTRITPGKHSVFVYYYTGMLSEETAFSSQRIQFYVETVDTDVWGLYFDLLVPYQAMLSLPENSYDRTRLQSILNRAAMIPDLRHTGGCPIDGDDFKAYHKSIIDTRDFLKGELYDKDMSVNGAVVAPIGHTHIDVAWLWSLAQTAEKAQRSFSTVIRLMEQYPDYVFMSSQPQLFQYVKENDPQLYANIKKRVQEGRFEVDGAMWLESDTNLVSGESLVRQIMLGKRFMKEEFGVDSTMLWLPDVFGYSGALPQILKKCGVTDFFTCKLSWCETDSFPHDNFIWQGIDGSEIFAVLSNGYVHTLDPATVKRFSDAHVEKTYTDTQMLTFGYGDGGGGPTAEMLENYERLKKGLPGFPKVQITRARDTMTSLREQFTENAEKLRFVPKWQGELYLEMHRGTYTTMAQNKKNNRLCELLYQSAETVAAIESLFFKDIPYPYEQFDRHWHTILKNQFHDILPGSSIKKVYDDCEVDYREVIGAGKEIYRQGLAVLAEHVQGDGGFMVYNPAPFYADGLIETQNGMAPVYHIPPHGWRVVKPQTAEETVKADHNSLENSYIRVEFDEKYQIKSLYDKKNHRQVIEPGKSANELRVFEDYPRCYDAWEISEYYKQKMWIVDDVSDVTVINKGCMAGLQIQRRYQHSRITQTILLTELSPRLDFQTEIDWQEDHVLLKAAFPTTVQSSYAKFEIQFGHIERPTHRNTSWDEAKFEVCAHKWADLSENGYGVSLLNDAKYGYSVEENVLSLSLLKAPTYPNPTADRGLHSFTYSLYPHAGMLAQGDTVRQSYLLNMPLVCHPAGKGDDTLPEEYSLVSSSTDAFVVETVKRAEDGEGLIVRGYEAFGGKETVALSFGFDVAKVLLCDLLENSLTECSNRSERQVSFDVRNFEIVTLRVIPA